MTVNVGVADDSELKEVVRSITNYDSTQLPSDDLDNQITVAKLRIKNKTQIDLTASDPFYSDDGITQALLFTTCIFAKSTVENIAADRWTVGEVNIETFDVGDRNAQQFLKWAELVAEGLQASEVEDEMPQLNVTNSFP